MFVGELIKTHSTTSTYDQNRVSLWFVIYKKTALVDKTYMNFINSTVFSYFSYSNRDSAPKTNREDDDESNRKCGLNRKSNISKDSKKDDKGCGNSEGILIRHIELFSYIYYNNLNDSYIGKIL